MFTTTIEKFQNHSGIAPEIPTAEKCMSDTFFSFCSHVGKAGPIMQYVKLIYVKGGGD